MSSGSRIVSFSLDPELGARFDAWVEREGFPSRSAALQRLVREELEGGGDGETPGLAMATVTFVYDHHQRELLERLTHLQHQHLDLVVSTTHVHLDHTRCLEVLILRGPGRAVSDLARALANTRGVERARISMLPISEQSPATGHTHGDQGPAWHTHAHTDREAPKPKKRAKASPKTRKKGPKTKRGGSKKR